MQTVSFHSIFKALCIINMILGAGLFLLGYAPIEAALLFLFGALTLGAMLL